MRDAGLSAAAAIVVASVLKWQAEPAQAARAPRFIAAFYKLKNAENPRRAPRIARANMMKAPSPLPCPGTMRGVNTASANWLKAVKALMAVHAAGISQIGDPFVDWLAARRLLHEIDVLGSCIARFASSGCSGRRALWLQASPSDGLDRAVTRARAIW